MSEKQRNNEEDVRVSVGVRCWGGNFACMSDIDSCVSDHSNETEHQMMQSSHETYMIVIKNYRSVLTLNSVINSSLLIQHRLYVY